MVVVYEPGSNALGRFATIVVLVKETRLKLAPLSTTVGGAPLVLKFVPTTVKRFGVVE
jgi:hypothetical protein